MTAHDPRVTLTEVLAAHADWDFTMTGRIACICGGWAEPDAGDDLNAGRHRAHLAEMIESEVIAACLAPIRALAEQWDTGCAREILSALDAPVSASQDHDCPCRRHDGAEGQGEGEGPADRRRCPTCGIPFAHYTHDPQGRPL